MAETTKAATTEKAAAAEDTTVYGEGDKETIEARKSASYYCPGCGRAYEDENAVCTGTPEAPHQPIDVVSTAELTGDPEKQTPAPTIPS